MAQALSLIKGFKAAPKSVRSKMDTIMFTLDDVAKWKTPDFQRPLHVNAKVMEIAQGIKQTGGVVPGIITLGDVDKDRYLVDGQHRMKGFELSGCTEGVADVRILTFDNLAEMGEEFVNLNSNIVKMRPDDRMRGLEGSNEGLAYIRRQCPYVGYGAVRRGKTQNSPLVSMSAAMRCWYGTTTDTPNTMGLSADAMAAQLTIDEAEKVVKFFKVAFRAWTREQAYWALWANNNLIITMWLWRNIHLRQYSPRSVQVDEETFTKCMMTLANAEYVDWLYGKTEKDRSPIYRQVTGYFRHRLTEELELPASKINFPSPPWFAGK